VPDTSEPGIAMLGSTGSGKSTFLCALEMALLQKDSNWLLYARDDASKMQLDEMSSALTSEGRFPLPTFGIDTFDWILGGKVERTERTRFSTRTVPQSVEITMKLTDSTGELGRSDQIGLQPRQQLMANLARSAGILYMFDPIREFNEGDAYARTSSLLRELIGVLSSDKGFDGRLPHHVAVCVTKLDDPRVYRTAESLKMLEWDQDHPQGFPMVHDSDARDLLHTLCKVGRNGTGEVVPRLLEKFFYPQRVRYFATSAVGFMVDKRTRRFDPQDTENVYRIASGKSLVRGPVNPVNVVEPVLWLIRQMTPSTWSR
jgi:hypothetical protein